MTIVKLEAERTVVNCRFYESAAGSRAFGGAAYEGEVNLMLDQIEGATDRFEGLANKGGGPG